ncbi:ABC transporter substrate-binding protein [Paenibacillus mendelii]|uniref:ABC transporter substrate-binding protein n=1 Tax=Paenibacillus mendelii TaxID=206163 RepID=A0ABV6JG88_9BACL|nr:ABC transporter substrate-binding protein [Paenibacillus mendelii]MCQ6557815.1 ABC transporter substrate-binding protein [Paenibacillus mendelii]
MKRRQTYSWLKLGMLAMLTAMLLLTAACGSKAEETNNTTGGGSAVNAPADTNTDDGNAASGNEGSSPSATVYPLTVKDATDVELTFAAAPQKVVTLLPSETEIMYAIGAGDQVVGVDDYTNYPEEAAAKTKIGGMEANIEAIVGLKPDLVLASSSMSKPAIDKLRELKLNVYATDPKTYDAVIEKIDQIGIIMDKTAKAAEVTQHMKDVRQQVQDAVQNAAKPNVYLEFSPGWTVGAGEFLDELIATAGGINIADQQGWYEIDPEQVIKTNPDVIIYASMIVKEGEINPILDLIQKRPGWNAIQAIKNKQVFEVDQDPLVRVGPRLAEGLQDVAKKLHPDLFK